jgi:hypothetical protein
LRQAPNRPLRLQGREGGSAMITAEPEVAEAWVPAAQWPDRYEISNLGRIRSVSRTVGLDYNWRGKRITRTLKVAPKILSVRVGRSGYLDATLSFPGQVSRTYAVHCLVCEAFHGPRPDGHQALHKNDNRSDARADNLYWGTRKQNAEDAWNNGRFIGCGRQSSPGILVHCRRGHLLSADNISVSRRGQRSCKVCARVSRLLRIGKASADGVVQ